MKRPLELVDHNEFLAEVATLGSFLQALEAPPLKEREPWSTPNPFSLAQLEGVPLFTSPGPSR
ncbi:hypothetical protein DEBA109399_04890 [Dermacoccus barathri]